ncbi:hypothetical protein Bca4012_009399 [Brassica carinata]
MALDDKVKSQPPLPATAEQSSFRRVPPPTVSRRVCPLQQGKEWRRLPGIGRHLQQTPKKNPTSLLTATAASTAFTSTTQLYTRFLLLITSRTLNTTASSTPPSETNTMTRRFSYAEKGKGIYIPPTTAPLRIRAPEIDTSQAIKDNELTLIGRLTNPKEQNMWSLIPYLSRRWSAKGTVVCSDLGQSCFQVRFESRTDLETVLANRPYHFARWMLIVQRWEPIISSSFPSQIPFWVKLKGLPLHYWDPDMLKNIGRELGRFDDLELSPTAARIRVTINGLKPLIKETIIEFASGDETMVSLEYDKLMNHCHFCNSLTHEERYCKEKRHNSLLEPRTLPNTEARKHHTQQEELSSLPRQETTVNQQRISTPEYERAQRDRLHFSQRRDRHGRPFGTRPSNRSLDPIYNKKETKEGLNPSPRKNRVTYSRSPVDSHSYRRTTADKPIHREDTSTANHQAPQLKDDSRRRSLSFGPRPAGSSMVWREKAPPSDNEQLNTPFTTPIPAPPAQVDPATIQHIHDNILMELQEVTMQYVNVPDPVESKARRLRRMLCKLTTTQQVTMCSMLGWRMGNQEHLP